MQSSKQQTIQQGQKQKATTFEVSMKYQYHQFTTNYKKFYAGMLTVARITKNGKGEFVMQMIKKKYDLGFSVVLCSEQPPRP